MNRKRITYVTAGQMTSPGVTRTHELPAHHVIISGRSRPTYPRYVMVASTSAILDNCRLLVALSYLVRTLAFVSRGVNDVIAT